MAEVPASAVQLDVWVIAEPDVRTSKAVRDEIQALCSKRGWNYQARTTVRAETRRRKGLFVLEGHAAEELYRRMHRARVAVLSLQNDSAQGPVVCKHPDRHTALNEQEVVSLRGFVLHKAFFRRLRDLHRKLGWVPQLEYWLSQTACEGPLDPRTLPFHIFRSQDGFHRRLHVVGARRDFLAAHHLPGALKDRRGLRWVRADALHGQEALAVAGCLLPRGFHWDVQASSPTTISTPTARWIVKKYVNISPDAHFRAADTRNAKKVG